jgi:hypothetical protein
MAAQDLDEAGHMRALEVMGQAHVHIKVSHRWLNATGAVLDHYGVADPFDADLVDGNAPEVGAALNVLDRG